MTTVRLAASTGPPRAFINGMSDPHNRPALLVSFYYLKTFQKVQKNLLYRDWVMDSGAFSAHNSGKTIDLQEYIETCRMLQQLDPTLTEIFALDVIGDYKASLKNCERMWEAGIQAIPCYHVGEPADVLKNIARDYPKIALGGAVGLKNKAKIEWAQACFKRIWPAKVHGFGFGGEAQIMAVPFHSVDATNWEMAPCAFGQWRGFGGVAMSVRGGNQNLRREVEFYLDLEHRARIRWEKQMRELEELGGTSPTVRLAVVSDSRLDKTFGKGVEDVPDR